MKNTTRALSLLLVIALVFSLTACFKPDVDISGLWEQATYVEDTELGTGSKTVTVICCAEDRSVTFTIHTNKETVGEALLEHQLISGEPGAYGLYVKVVNGITADYDVNQCYWAFYENDDYAMSGVDLTNIEEGTIYKLIYTKG